MDKQKVLNENGLLIYNLEANDEIDKNEQTVKLIACGDTGPVRNLEAIVSTKGPDFVLGEIKDILSTGDIVFANLEAPYSKRGKSINRIPTFRLHPNAFSIIKRSHINIVSLANNHIFDYGLEAFDDTIGLLKTTGIRYFGAGRTEDEAVSPAIFSVNDIRFGFLGFIETESKVKNFSRGITPLEVILQMHYEKVRKAIKDLRPKVDWIILSVHFGWECQLYPSPKDVKLCRQFIEEGADIILGHHPHYPQGIEKYKNGLIAYSLGNFIWDQNFVGHTSSSFILELNLMRKKIESVKLYPFRLSRRYKLEILKDDELMNAMNELNELSTILMNNKALNEKWYFICREKCVIFCRHLLNVAFSLKPKSHRIMVWWRAFLSPRAIHTWRSLLEFILTGRGFIYESKKRIKKKR